MPRFRLVLSLLMLCVSAFAGCAAAPPVGRQVASASIWTEPFTVAQAQQADAPALVLRGDQLIAAWVGMDARGVPQDARIVSMNAPDGQSAITLPLPPTHPYNQQMLPGTGGAVHLLWLDAGEDDQTNLYSALLSPELAVLRGPVSLSDGLALAYSAVPDGNGGLWAAWSGGLLAEMSVYVRRVDDEGRPLLDTTTIASGANDPALLRTNDGQVWLFWTADGRLMRQRLDMAGEAQAITGVVSLAPGDRLMNVRAALDLTTAYFFWNVTRTGGVSETWWTAGALDAPLWRQPERLVTESGVALRRVMPLTEQRQTQGAAVESDSGIAILSLRGGEVRGRAEVLPGVHLIGLPALAVDAATNTLYLAWSQPGEATADLKLMVIPPTS
jgi:hypothetical protein